MVLVGGVGWGNLGVPWSWLLTWSGRGIADVEWKGTRGRDGRDTLARVRNRERKGGRRRNRGEKLIKGEAHFKPTNQFIVKMLNTMGCIPYLKTCHPKNHDRLKIKDLNMIDSNSVTLSYPQLSKLLNS